MDTLIQHSLSAFYSLERNASFRTNKFMQVSLLSVVFIKYCRITFLAEEAHKYGDIISSLRITTWSWRWFRLYGREIINHSTKLTTKRNIITFFIDALVQYSYYRYVPIIMMQSKFNSHTQFSELQCRFFFIYNFLNKSYFLDILHLV